MILKLLLVEQVTTVGPAVGILGLSEFFCTLEMEIFLFTLLFSLLHLCSAASFLAETFSILLLIQDVVFLPLPFQTVYILLNVFLKPF